MSGRSGTVDFDDSDDDAFEQIPSETLRELEQEAIRATQQPLDSRPAPHPPKFNERNRPVLTTIQNNAGQSSRQPPGLGAQEELVNLDDYTQGGHTYYGATQTQQSTAAGQAVNRSQWGYGQPRQISYREPSQTALGPRQAPAPGASQILPRGPDIASLKATIQRLEREKLALKQAAQDAQSREQVKSGEVSILRETLTRSTNEYEQKIETLRQVQVEAADKSQAEIRALQRAKEKVETDRKFLEHDLSVEAGKKQSSKPQSFSGASLKTRSGVDTLRGAVSSRKSSLLNVGDGFEEEELFRQSPRKNRSFDNGVSSPSHRRESVKPTTPSHRSEKRRKRDTSPSAQAELSFQDPADSPDFTPFTPDHSFDYDALAYPEFGSLEKLDFIERVMDHRVSGTGHHLLEELAKYSLPSNPDATFAGLVLNQLNAHKLEAEQNPALSFCNAICEAWSQCLTERYHDPLNLLVESLNFAFSSQRFTLLRNMVDKAVLLATQTVELVADAVHQKARTPNDVRDIPNVDTEECMKLLIILATACAESQEYTTQYWRIVGFRFVSLILTVHQPLPLVSMMCELLTFSGSDSSFGPIFLPNDSIEVESQDDIDFWIGDRLISFLFDISVQSGTGPEASFPLFHLLPFRLKVLDALAAMCINPRSEASLTGHLSAIARLFEFLYEHVETLYSYEPHVVSSPRLVSLTVACINKVMFVIYQLLKTPIKSEDEDGTEMVANVDVREKLKAVNGGEFMHTIALTRLVFGEQPDLAFIDLEPEELEIWTHVGDTAHRLLDEFLSPDEGEMLLRMYSTGEQALGSAVTGGDDTRNKDSKMNDDTDNTEDDDTMEVGE